MDDNMRLILLHSSREPPRWEEEMPANYDHDALVLEFRERLYRRKEAVSEPHYAQQPLVLGGIEGKDLDNLALALVSEVPAHRRQNDLRYVLERALLLLDSQVAGKGMD